MTQPRLILNGRIIDKPAIDLRYRHFESKRHNINIIGTWLYDDADRSSQPCLVLLHGLRPIAKNRTMPCIIALDQAWRWAMHGGVGDPEHCGRTVSDWLNRGYLPGSATNKKDLLRVLDVVNSRLTDLINMPPAPTGDSSAAIGDMVALDRKTGLVLTEREIIHDV